MCIRDRAQGRQPGELRPNGGTRGGWNAGRPCSAQHRDVEQEPREEPVSYTHLTLPTICSV
eukprot:4082489-Alexandrium_andersonii.AAC.1